MGFRDRLSHGWNAFLNRDQTTAMESYSGGMEYGAGSSTSQARNRFGFSGDQSIMASIYTRLSVDAASVDIRHVMLDEEGRYVRDVLSGLHNCLNVEANIDQSGRAFLQDIYYSLFTGGMIALMPVEMSNSPANGGLYDVITMKVGSIVQFYPRHVTVEAYNDKTGRRERVTLDKRFVGIVENPFHAVMNEPNSTLQRLIRKLRLLDNMDEITASGKLDMIIQLPYPIRNEGRRADAQQRRADIEFQLKDSTHGIAYIDATEKVTQLNRPVENTLILQVEKLFELLYAQLGLTAKVMDGTATEAEMLAYYNRTIEPTIGAVAAELKRKFLTKTARTQGHDVMYFRDPFKLVPMAELAELADKFTRNEIVTSNEFRGFIGMRPAKDPKADMLINSNLTVPQTQLEGGVQAQPGAIPPTDDEIVLEEGDMFEGVLKELDDAIKELGAGS